MGIFVKRQAKSLLKEKTYAILLDGGFSLLDDGIVII